MSNTNKVTVLDKYRAELGRCISNAADRHIWNAILGKDLSAEEFITYRSIVNTYSLPTEVVINLGLSIFAGHTAESFRQTYPELYI